MAYTVDSYTRNYSYQSSYAIHSSQKGMSSRDYSYHEKHIQDSTRKQFGRTFEAKQPSRPSLRDHVDPRNIALNKSMRNATPNIIFSLWKKAQQENLKFNAINFSTAFNCLSKSPTILKHGFTQNESD